MVKLKKSVQEVASEAEPIAVERTAIENDLHASLEEIKKCDGVIGYIVRNTTSASVNLKDPSKIIEYAILSSTSFDVGKDFSQLFGLGDIKNLLIEGRNLKMLSLTTGENKISIFMEKDAHTEKALQKLLVF
jgi:predicted regulator of Ras-like GTPase activity (Roadblock/LC7/MglB family)